MNTIPAKGHNFIDTILKINKLGGVGEIQKLKSEEGGWMIIWYSRVHKFLTPIYCILPAGLS